MMSQSTNAVDLKEFHWIMDLLMTIDVGLVVLDRDHKIQLWNSFMHNHSGLSAHYAKGKTVFEIFPEVEQDWLEHKLGSVFLLKNRSFIIWEQRPYLFKFKNYRPITGTEPYMFQNIVISPLASADGSVNHVCLLVYDVTDIAVGKKSLEKSNHQLEALSRTDRLTALNNRGYWEECLVAEFDRCKRYAAQSSLVMFDIDHFKKVNDTYGHQAGDEVIRMVSQKLRDTIRSTDVAGRYGGEEFGVILTETDATSALIFCERLRKNVEQALVLHEGQEIKVTISLGICEMATSMPGHEDWLEKTDQALYLGKKNGRNQANIYRDDGTGEGQAVG